NNSLRIKSLVDPISNNIKLDEVNGDNLLSEEIIEFSTRLSLVITIYSLKNKARPRITGLNDGLREIMIIIRQA
ncbi:3546_t:CDS:1, partial [Racocetra persica]